MHLHITTELEPDNQDTLGQEDAAPQTAESKTILELEQFVSPLEAVKRKMKAIYASDGPRRGQNPFLEISDKIAQRLVAEAFEQKPWSTTERLLLNIDGVECPISYKVFTIHGRIADLRKWHSAAIDSYMCTFDRVCELLCDREKTIRYNGWARARKWWPEIIERAFRQNPFIPLHELKLNHNGKKIKTPYEHARHSGSEEDQKYVWDLYENVFREYIEESFEHALEYIFKNGQFLWEKVPEKWHKEFLKKCFEQHPFGGAHNALKFTYRKKR